jgi:hypothetical protein
MDCNFIKGFIVWSFGNFGFMVLDFYFLEWKRGNPRVRWCRKSLKWINKPRLARDKILASIRQNPKQQTRYIPPLSSLIRRIRTCSPDFPTKSGRFPFAFENDVQPILLSRRHSGQTFQSHRLRNNDVRERQSQQDEEKTQ